MLAANTAALRYRFRKLGGTVYKPLPGDPDDAAPRPNDVFPVTAEQRAQFRIHTMVHAPPGADATVRARVQLGAEILAWLCQVHDPKHYATWCALPTPPVSCLCPCAPDTDTALPRFSLPCQLEVCLACVPFRHTVHLLAADNAHR